MPVRKKHADEGAGGGCDTEGKHEREGGSMEVRGNMKMRSEGGNFEQKNKTNLFNFKPRPT